LDSSLALVARDLGWAYVSAGFPDSAALLADRYRTAVATHAAFAAAAGRRDQAIPLLREAKADVAAGREEAFDVFLAELALGEIDSSLTWLTKSVQKHETGLTLSFFPCDPFFAPLDGNQRYLALLGRLGIPECPETVRKRTNR
jgi:hypothetical protein